MIDGVSEWWRHEVQVRRHVEASTYGSDSTADTVTGYYKDETLYNVNGSVRASGRFAYPYDVHTIPLESHLTLPAAFGARPVKVVGSQIGYGGGQATPDHKIVEVL